MSPGNIPTAMNCAVSNVIGCRHVRRNELRCVGRTIPAAMNCAVSAAIGSAKPYVRSRRNKLRGCVAYGHVTACAGTP